MCASSCKRNKYAGENPFFHEWETPFALPPFDDIKVTDYKPAFVEGMKRQLEEIDAIVKNTAAPDFENVILALDNSGQMLARVNATFSLVSTADTNDEIQAIEQEIVPMLTSHSNDIYLNQALFDKVAEVYIKRGESGLDALQQRLTKKTYDKFVRSGALLSDQGKEALRAINEQLATAQIKFGNNILAANKAFLMVVDTADVADLPSGLKTAAAEEAEKAGHKGRYAFTLSKPSMLPFLTNSSREDLRKTLYEGYLNRCNYGDSTDNRQIINDIVRLRTERAKLLGFDTHADYMLQERMAADPAAVYHMLDGLWEPALASAGAEMEEMKAIKAAEGRGSDFNSWDWWYYAEKVRKQKYALDEEMLKPYFSLANVQRGIFDLCNRLYGLTFKPVNNVPVYNKECSVYEVFDGDNTHLGVLLMDFHPRDGKSVGAWCEIPRPRSYDAAGKKTADPFVIVVCNFTRPVGTQPSLLTLDETETFFHEFGHAVHMLMIDVPYRGLIDVEQDFVELPSQIMENWALEPQMLSSYALHYSSKAPIPEHLIDKITGSSYFNQGFTTTEYLGAAYIDMDIHTRSRYEELDVNAFESEMLNTRRGLMPEIAPRYRYPYFKHIFDSESYSAGYYSYIWAEVLDKDAYECFASSGDIFNRAIATSFRKNILNKGGSEDGMTMYRNFRGGDPSGEYLLYARGLKERPEKEAAPAMLPLPEGEVPPMDNAEIFGPGSPKQPTEENIDSLNAEIEAGAK